MKYIHDQDTVDMVSVERTFQLYPHIWVSTDGDKQRRQYLQQRVASYLHEKPYRREALRRTVK